MKPDVLMIPVPEHRRAIDIILPQPIMDMLAKNDGVFSQRGPQKEDTPMNRQKPHGHGGMVWIRLVLHQITSGHSA